MISNQINKLNIIQWNCNSMINKCDLLSNFLNDFKPDIMMLNETKCTAEIANFNFDHPRYELIFNHFKLSLISKIDASFCLIAFFKFSKVD
jgi:exonuclease III